MILVKNSSYNSGFTIVEVILGLGIFALMGGGLYMVYTNAVRIDRDSARISDLTREGYWTISAIERDLANMANYHYTEQSVNEARSMFIGSSNGMSFVIEGEDGVLQSVAYQLSDTPVSKSTGTTLGNHYTKNTQQVINAQTTINERKVLSRNTGVFQGRPFSDSNGTSSEVLTKNIHTGSVKFLYARPMSASDGGTVNWTDQWHGINPPAAVRIALTLTDRSGASGLALTQDILVPAGGQD